MRGLVYFEENLIDDVRSKNLLVYSYLLNYNHLAIFFIFQLVGALILLIKLSSQLIHTML
jgi:hypothetical protein